MKDFWRHKKRCTDFKKWQRGKKKAVSLTLHFINARIKIEHICISLLWNYLKKIFILEWQ